MRSWNHLEKKDRNSSGRVIYKSARVVPPTPFLNFRTLFHLSWHGNGKRAKKETQGTRGNTRGHQGTQGTQQRNEPQTAKHKQTKNKPWPTTSKPRANHKPRSTPKCHQNPPKILPKCSPKPPKMLSQTGSSTKSSFPPLIPPTLVPKDPPKVPK